MVEPPGEGERPREARAYFEAVEPLEYAPAADGIVLSSEPSERVSPREESIMGTKTLTIPYPEELLGEVGATPEAFEQELRFLVAAKLYELGRLSSGRAAELVGIPRVAFLHELGRYRISVFNYSQAELEREIQEAQARARHAP
jgi:predicted HTH domain antitoxin